MKLIENNSIIPLKDYLTKDKDWDYFICCSSFEERCTRTSDIMLTKKIKIGTTILFNYIEKDTGNKKDKNIKKMKRTLEKMSNSVKIFDNPSVFKPSNGIKLFKTFLNENKLDLLNRHLLIDITVFTKPYFFLLFKMLIDEYHLQNFDILYTEPSNYGNENVKNEFSLTQGLDKVNSFPGFRGQSVNSEDVLIVILGFEGKNS